METVEMLTIEFIIALGLARLRQQRHLKDYFLTKGYNFNTYPARSQLKMVMATVRAKTCGPITYKLYLQVASLHKMKL